VNGPAGVALSKRNRRWGLTNGGFSGMALNEQAAAQAVTNKCKALSTRKSGEDPENTFYLCTLGMIDLLKGKMDTLMYAKALIEEPLIQFDDE
jgi:hypothetical protein